MTIFALSYNGLLLLAGTFVFLYLVLVWVDAQRFNNITAVGSIFLRASMVVLFIIGAVNLGFNFRNDAKIENNTEYVSEYREIFQTMKKEMNSPEVKAEIWNNNKPVEDILPLPIGWLDSKLGQEGKLENNVAKISF